MEATKPSSTWRQSSSSVTISIFTAEQALAWPDVLVEFEISALTVTITRARGSDLCFMWDPLAHHINVAECSWDLSGQTLIIELVKAEAGVEWSTLEAAPAIVTARSHAPVSGVGFQIMSDLHLEFHFATPPRGSAPGYDVFVPPAIADNLALLGDIGLIADREKLFEFLERQLPRFKRVFFVAGNHEFYRSASYEEGLEKMTAFAARMAERRQSDETIAEFIFLNRTRYDIPGSDVTILGCTLWSNIPPEDHDLLKATMNDFRRIGGWSPARCTQTHFEDVAWLESQLEEIQSQDPARKIAIFSHHAPTLDGTSNPQHHDSPIACGFATELSTNSKLWKPQSLKLWAFGHTHWCCDRLVNGVRVFANQHGYQGIETRMTASEFDISSIVYV